MKPIIIYKNKKFYNLDEVEDYHVSISSIQKRRDFIRFINNKISESDELYEMAYNRQEFINECSYRSRPIHYTIANIICLGDTHPEIVNHWKHELLGFLKDLITVKTDKSVKRTKLVTEILIQGYADQYKDGFSYIDSYLYELAMKDEIHKGSKHNNSLRQKLIAKYIKSDILPNIDEYVEPNKNRVYLLFKALIKAVDKSDLLIFEKELDNFILNE